MPAVIMAAIISLILPADGTFSLTSGQREVSRVIASEACSEGLYGQILVANVIQNRARVSGKPFYEIVTAPGQFAGYVAKNKHRLYSECGKTTDRVVAAMVNGTLPDYARGLMRFRTTPKWLKALPSNGPAKPFVYKNHVFY